MTSQLIPFNFDDSLIRSTLIYEQPWFVASDIAKALEYRDAHNMIRILDEDEADTHIVSIRSENGVEQDRQVTIINQSGLFHAILKSRKPEAKRFRKWVTGDLLPTLYRDGGYSLNDQAEKQRLDNVRAGLRLRGEVERLIDKAKRERNPELRATLHAALVESCAAASLPAPSLDALGGPDLAERSRLDAFWAAVSELMATGEEINHSHDPARLAISLPHLQRLAEKHRVKLPKPSHIRRCLRASEVPMFIDYRTVHSALFGGSVKCWVFAQEGNAEQEATHE